MLSTPLARGLEEVYSEVIKFVLSEKIIGDFNKETQKYAIIIGNVTSNSARNVRYSYLSKNITKSSKFIKEQTEKHFLASHTALRNEKTVDLRRRREQLAADKKRMAVILKGIENRKIIHPLKGNFHYATGKGVPKNSIWHPTLLMDGLASDEDSGPSRPTRSQAMALSGIRRRWDKFKAREMTTAGPALDEKPLVRYASHTSDIESWRCRQRRHGHPALFPQNRAQAASKVNQTESAGGAGGKAASKPAGPDQAAGALAAGEFDGPWSGADSGDRRWHDRKQVYARDQIRYRYATVLTEAASMNDVVTVLSYGKNANNEVNVRDEKGNTALHYTCFNNNAEMARVLLNLGARTDIRNSEGDTQAGLAQRLGLAKVGQCDINFAWE